MALLLRDREASVEAAAPPPGGEVNGVPPRFACEVCGAEMDHGQDWCLECGRAAPGRLGARPGWRAAFTVVGLTLLLVCCAVVASYAALTSKAERSASAPPAGSGQPIVAGTPPVIQPAPATPIQPGPTGPGTTPPTAGTPPPITGKPIIPVPQTAAPPSNVPVIPPGTKTPATGTQIPPSTATPPTASTPSTPTRAPTVASSPQVVPLKAGAASTYDPGKRAGAEFGPAANAIDKNPATVWDVVVPADGQPLGVGLLIKLGAPLTLHSLKLDTPTPGFRVELYAAVDDKQLPTDIIDKRWIHLTDRKSVVDGQPISLKGKGDGAKFKLVMLYVTHAAEATDPRVAIGNVELRATL